MTILIVLAWLVLTRTGRTERVWPSDERVRRRRPAPTLELDPTAVSLEVGVAAIALILIPWTMFFDAFPPAEVLALLAMWPFIFRLCVDRIYKLRSGFLVEVTDSGIEVPGFPKRTASWADVKAVAHRRVRFGPDDIVIRCGIVPIVLDTQFTPLSESEAVDWAIATFDDHV
jgi:hypothetical protein